MSTKMTEQYKEMENRLAKVLRPVTPSRKLVQTVRRRIHFSPPVVVADRLRDSRRVVFAIGGVLSASLLVAIGVRALFYLANKSRV